MQLQSTCHSVLCLTRSRLGWRKVGGFVQNLEDGYFINRIYKMPPAPPDYVMASRYCIQDQICQGTVSLDNPPSLTLEKNNAFQGPSRVDVP